MVREDLKINWNKRMKIIFLLLPGEQGYTILLLPQVIDNYFFHVRW